MKRANDGDRMASAVEEVRVTKRDMTSAHVHQTLDVAQNRVRLHDPYAPVVDRGNRAVPAAVHAAMAGLHVADEALLGAHRQAGVALERGQQLARRRVEAPALKMDDGLLASPGEGAGAGQSARPGQQRRLVLTGDRAARELADHQLAAHRRVQAVEADRQPRVLAAKPAGRVQRQAHGGVHRHREADRLRPVQCVGIPGLHAQVQAADFVPGAAQGGGRGRDVQRLVVQLVGGDQQDAHAARTLAHHHRLS